MNTWITADTHFGHANMTDAGPHPFERRRPFATVAEMDAALEHGWNSLVQPGDDVFVVGDFTLGNLDRISKYLSRLMGTIYIIPGSHDDGWLTPWRKMDPHVRLRSRDNTEVTILTGLETRIVPGHRLDGHWLTITMCHYQMASWPYSHYGHLHVFGHHHGRRNGIGRSMDVGVDTNNFRPYNLIDIAERLLALKPVGKYEGELQPVDLDKL